MIRWAALGMRFEHAQILVAMQREGGDGAGAAFLQMHS